jgi:DUF3037 family protein
VPEARRDAFQYAVLRVVPRVERGECFNAGVVLFCRTRGFLGAQVALDERKLAALAPEADAAAVERHLRGLARVAAGDEEAGPIARLSQSERFGWIVAPSSTMVQASEVHTGLALKEPADELRQLFASLVAG